MPILNISDWHTLGYNGRVDGHWVTADEAAQVLALDPQSKPAQAVRRGIELANIEIAMGEVNHLIKRIN